MTRPAPPLSLAHGDFLPKNLLIDDGAIVGVLDWEFTGPASPAFSLARWEVSACDPLHDRSDERVAVDDLLGWVAARVTPYKKLRALEFVATIRKSPSGKILRRLLRSAGKDAAMTTTARNGS